jgi:hypothetical protein
MGTRGEFSHKIEYYSPPQDFGAIEASDAFSTAEMKKFFDCAVNPILLFLTPPPRMPPVSAMSILLTQSTHRISVTRSLATEIQTLHSLLGFDWLVTNYLHTRES